MKTLLSGVRVLDLTRLLPGPYAALLLADLGAEVIKIEEPGRGDPVRGVPPFVEGRSTRFLALNRNKRSVTLDLKRSEGREILLRLARKADAMMENLRPGVTRRLKIDYGVIHQINPGIIYCSLSAYGQESPYRDHVGHDLNYIARAGLLSLMGEPPVIPGVPVADLAGAMFAALAVVAALRARDQGQGGAFIDVSLTDALVSWMTLHLAEQMTKNEALRPQDLVLTGRFPCYQIYETKDGRYLAVGALEEKFWTKLCQILGVPQYIPHQFSEEKREEVLRTFRTLFTAKTRAEWLEALDPREIPISPVLDLAEVADDPHLRERGLIRPDEPGITFPIRIAQGSQTADLPAPELGADTRETLKALGYSPDEIDQLAHKGVI